MKIEKCQHTSKERDHVISRVVYKYVAPDLFTAETPLGTYQGMTDQIVLSRTPGAFRTVLVPRGSSKPEWLPSNDSIHIYYERPCTN